MKKLIRGFTLIELLVVIGVIAILAAIVLVAVNPSRNFAQARNTQRRNDIYQVLNACHQYAVSNDGNFPTGIPIGSANAIELGTCGTCLDLSTIIDKNNNVFVSSYIPAIPIDPSSTVGSAANTGYFVFQESVGGRLTASASAGTEGPGYGELGEKITITR